MMERCSLGQRMTSQHKAYNNASTDTKKEESEEEQQQAQAVRGDHRLLIIPVSAIHALVLELHLSTMQLHAG